MTSRTPTAWESTIGACRRQRFRTMSCSPTRTSITALRTTASASFSWPTASRWIWASSQPARHLARLRRLPLPWPVRPVTATRFIAKSTTRVRRSRSNASASNRHIPQEFRHQRVGQLQRKQEHGPRFFEDLSGWSSRTLAAGSTTGGPAWAHRVSTTANWSGEYSVTQKLSLDRPILLR